VAITIIWISIISDFLWHINSYATQDIYDALEALEVEYPIVVDADPEVMFYGPLHQPRPAALDTPEFAVEVGTIDSILSASWDLHPQVPRYGEQDYLPLNRVNAGNDDHICPARQGRSRTLV
jgi:hypothetical protein